MNSCYCSLAVLMVAAAASSAPMVYTVPNGSFENPTIGDGGLSALTDWSLQGTAGGFNPVNAQYAGTTGGSLPAPALGNTLAYVNSSPTFYITSAAITTLQPDRVYTLDVAVGDRLDTLWGGYSIELLVGATLVASVSDTDLGAAIPAAGTFVTQSLTYTAPGVSDPLIGQDIQVRLRGGTGGTQTNFDNVELSSVIPEPTTMALLAGAGALALVRRQHR